MIAAALHEMLTYVLAKFCKSALVRPGSHLLFAHIDGQDVTTELQTYYMYDPVLSCGSMIKWLDRLGTPIPDTAHIDLLYRIDLHIYRAVIDLHEEQDVQKKRRIEFSDMTLHQSLGQEVLSL